MGRKEVAKLAGVSEATVSRVMNNVGPIKKETKEKVLDAAQQLGYEINALAQQLARQKSGNIGVILPDVPKVHLFSTYYFSQILSGIAEVARSMNINLLMVFHDSSEPNLYTKLFRSKKVDSCIILGANENEEEKQELQQLIDEQFPFVLINQRYPNTDFRYVDGDHQHGSYLATTHLLEQGAKNIAFLNGPKHFSNSMDRYYGYEKALRDHNHHVQQDLLYEGNYSKTSGITVAEHLAARIVKGEIDSVFAANDRMAIGVMEGLRTKGIIAGNHYRIVGYDNSDGSNIVTPKLSTISVPFYDMGVKAASMLLLEQDKNISHHMMPVTLKVRESSIL